MPPVGPNAAHQEHAEPQSQFSVSLTTGASDILLSTSFSCGYARRLYCNAAGNLAIKRTGDTAFVTYAVLQGAYIDGHIAAIGSTAHGSTSGLVVIAEV